jgi:hypothetical protein
VLLKIGATMFLDESAKLWATMLEESFKGVEYSYVDVAGVFDKDR